MRTGDLNGEKKSPNIQYVWVFFYAIIEGSTVVTIWVDTLTEDENNLALIWVRFFSCVHVCFCCSKGIFLFVLGI